ncbi:MAG: hypothetical protein H8E25_12580 [Planctomycetes bacterium]|nr:hypothetical protein [Planctomycetota bacterium]
MIICTTLLLFAQADTAQTLDEQIAAAKLQGQQTEAGIATGEITGFEAVDAWSDVAYSWETISGQENAPASVWVNWSEALLNANDSKNALSVVQNGLVFFKNNAPLQEQSGRLLLSESRSAAEMGNDKKAQELTASAVAAFTAACKSAPKSASPLLRLGEVAWIDFANTAGDEKAKTAALQFWLDAVTVDPAGVDSGHVYTWLQTDAIEVLNVLVTKQPENVLHYWYRGMAHYYSGAQAWTNTHDDFMKVIELNSAFTNAYFFLADGAFQRGAMQSTAGDTNKAKKAYNFAGKYYALYLKDFGANHTASSAQNGGLRAECERMNFLASFTSYPDAILILEWATSSDDSYLDIWNNLAFLYRETNEAEKSLAAYQHALSIAPDDPQIMNDLAVIYHYYLQSDDEIAIELYEQAIVRANEILAGSNEDGKDLSLVKTALRDAKNNLAKLKKGNRRNG